MKRLQALENQLVAMAGVLLGEGSGGVGRVTL